MNKTALEVIEKYKTHSGLLLLIDGSIMGSLSPITYDYKSSRSEIIPLICQWRNENSIGFANRFEGTPQRTEQWIDNVLLPRKDRILFMIFSNGEWTGHIGLSSFDDTSCEIDNVVRGVKGGVKGIMSLATKRLVEWAREALDVERICLRVLSDNPNAIQFYTRLGFEIVGETPLYRWETENMIEWTEEPNGDEPEKYFIKMELR